MLIINVDDDPEDREIFSEAVRAIDPLIKCLELNSCAEALSYLDAAAVLPDYVFLDINMPKVNGYECVKNLANAFDLARLRIVMYSTYFNPNDQVAFSSIGVKYLVKSNTFDGLVENLKMLINVREGQSKT